MSCKQRIFEASLPLMGLLPTNYLRKRGLFVYVILCKGFAKN
jgi:hypothetical protein